MKHSLVLVLALVGCSAPPLDAISVQWRKEDCDKRGLLAVGFYNIDGELYKIQCQIPKETSCP